MCRCTGVVEFCASVMASTLAKLTRPTVRGAEASAVKDVLSIYWTKMQGEYLRT